jgi:hypothetical protein
MYPRRDEQSELYGDWASGGRALGPQFASSNNFRNGYDAVDLVDGRHGLIRTDGTLLSLIRLAIVKRIHILLHDCPSCRPN